MLRKEVSHKRSHIVYFRLNGISGIGKSIDTEGRLVMLSGVEWKVVGGGDEWQLMAMGSF